MVNWLTRKKVLSSGGTFLLWGGLWLGLGGALLLGGCAPRSEYVTFTGFRQGTTYSIIVRDPAPDTAARIDSVFRAIDLTFSMFNPESLTSRINRNEVVAVTPLFAECFRLARQIHRDTEGLYDPTVKPLIDAWGFGPGAMQRRPNLDSLLEFVGLDKIALAEAENIGETGEVGWRIVKSDPRVQLDFSSIAKGFTVDKMAEMLALTSGSGSRTHSDSAHKKVSDGRSSDGRRPTVSAGANPRAGTGADGADGTGRAYRANRADRADGRCPTVSGGANPRAGIGAGGRADGAGRAGGRAGGADGAGGRVGAKKILSWISNRKAGGTADSRRADFLVEVGGEIRVQGVNRQGLSWRVQIDRPEGGFAHQQAAVITLGGRNTKPATRGRNAESTEKGRCGRPAEQSLRTESTGKGRSGRPAEQGGNPDGESGESGESGGSGGIGGSAGSGGVLTAVATSGNYRNHFVDEDGATRVHTIDPHTGAPAAGQILSASVVSSSCALSDGWATALIAARDLSTARRLLDKAALLAADNPQLNAAQRSDASQHSADNPQRNVTHRSGASPLNATQRSGASRPAGTQPFSENAGVPALEWYIITEDGVEQSPEFPIE